MAREYRNNIAISYEGVAKVSPTWNESAMLADGILKNIEKADSVNVLYNKFKSVIAYELSSVVVSNAEALAAAPNIASYEVEEEVLKNYAEFALANTLYWAIAEGYASEMAARRTAMENATKNAGDMISKLTLTFNRQRQAVITNELCDIITGASAL
ncbi:atp3 gamma subunit of the F1 sector of mitochondrial F1F0 ATP synthase [Clydaea vesicula]|uniref:ATP synthase subunit gamma, mitochondrial n=1 Tax=Clydaea vesicula TaxID=447962 RepID=A0AAD5Y1Z3_9FUNG|nr:atp3 gamma subunit of the F1 sector of mitochondrial F1F0 ATP synthase [Clydaea vesicula]